MWKIFKLLLLQFAWQCLQAADYAIIGDDQTFFQACDAHDDGGTTNLKELVEFNMINEYADDMETIITNGNVTILVDIDPQVPISLEVEIYKWERGTWVDSIFSIRRPNFCATAFSPKEFWYPFIKQFPEENRVCPPKKGHVYQFKDIKNRMDFFNVTMSHDYSGKYKAIIYFIVDQYSLCLSSVVDVWSS
uniref:MD-2-related lipid-recognition domain-containing protein n=1 Tax=Stomoxys calcitrans TaxID=35570 RepID=A0A1I8NX48_STOCA